MNVFNSSSGILTDPNGMLGKVFHLDCAVLAGLFFPAGDSVAICAAISDACANPPAREIRGIAEEEIARAHCREAYGNRWAAVIWEAVE